MTDNKGYSILSLMPVKKITEQCTVICTRCRVTWSEEVTHYGMFAGYARQYDFCDKCITEDEKNRLDK